MSGKSDNTEESPYPGFRCAMLDQTHCIYVGELPPEISFSSSQFDQLWQQHPDEYHEIMMHGRLVRTPRWQQAYGKDYHYTGKVNPAIELPPLLQPFLQWTQQMFDERLNGVLLNWYDGNLGHYMGPHRDSRKNMYHGAPIITLSLGQQRTFRLRPWKGAGKIDFQAPAGTVFVMPYSTNLAWTHEIPKSKAAKERRISITVRAFE